MKYFIDPNTRGRDVLEYIKNISTHEEMVEFIHSYQRFLNMHEGKPEYDRRVIERTVYYMLGFMTGIGIDHKVHLMDKWKVAINQELYSKDDVVKVEDHRLIEL